MDLPLAKLERVSDDERHLLDAYRNLDVEARRLLLRLAEIYACRALERRPHANVVQLRALPR